MFHILVKSKNYRQLAAALEPTGTCCPSQLPKLLPANVGSSGGSREPARAQ